MLSLQCPFKIQDDMIVNFYAYSLQFMNNSNVMDYLSVIESKKKNNVLYSEEKKQTRE